MVLHRAKFGIVTLQKSTEKLFEQSGGDAETGLFLEGKEILEEALGLVRKLSASPASEAKKSSEENDARTQFRINTAAQISVLLPQHAKAINARLSNISWGGAAFIMDAEVASGDLIKVILPRPQGGSIAIEAGVLRTWDRTEDSSLGVSVRFSSLSTRDEQKLEDILEHMAQSAEATEQREYARLAQRLDIEFNGVHELQSTLDDISAGGLEITVPNPLLIGQSLQTVISIIDGSCALKLRARVVRQKTMKIRNTPFYRVGLTFEHPSAELKKRTQELIAKMARAKSD